MKHILNLTDDQEAGWAIALAEENAIRQRQGLDPYLIDDLLFRGLAEAGDKHLKQDTLSKKTLVSAKCEAEILDILRAKGYRILGLP